MANGIFKLAAAAAIVQAFAALAAQGADWSAFKVENPAGSTKIAGPDKRHFAFYSSMKEGTADISSLVAPEYVEFRVNSLRPGETVKIRYAPYTNAGMPRGGRDFRMVASCVPAQELKTVIEGNIDEEFAKANGIKRRHHWKQLIRPVGEERTLLTRDFEFVEGLKHFGVKLELTRPATIRIYDVDFREPCAAEGRMTVWEPGRNYLLNGGAERGWYGTAAPGVRAATCADGKIPVSKSCMYSNGITRMAIDREEAHSGKCSFRFTTPPGAMGENVFYFNPVPYQPGAPACYSVWMKSDKNTRVRMNLFLANGIAYNWEVGVGKEWRQYDVAIPEWGAKGKGGPNFFGDVVNGYAKGIRYCMMQFGFRDDNSTVWLDDAYYGLGVANRVDAPQRQVTAHATLDKPVTVYRPGETVRATLKISNLGDRAVRVPVKGKMLDALGAKIKASGLERREVEVPAKGEASVEFAAKPPAAKRGAMNVVFDVDGETTGCYFGVQERPDGLDPRLGLNVFDGSETVIRELLQEFGVGTARIWGGFRDWFYDGLKYVGEFERAGIRMMYVVAGPERETLLPADPSAWFAEFAGKIAPYRGKIEMYEFLNEINIWSGRRKNPDPSKWDSPCPESYVKHLRAFREMMAKADPQAKIAGPTTCNTDLPYIRKVLDLGGRELLDVVTEHSYRQLPECPDYWTDLDALHQMIDGAPRKIAHAQTEAGRQQLPHFVDDLIDDFARAKASWEVRNMITAWAHGADHYSHFTLGPVRAGADWNVTMLGNGGNGWEARPGVCMYAYRAASDRLRGAKGVERVKLGVDYRAYVFDNGRRRIAAIWKWNGNPDRCTMPLGRLADCRVWDFMGTRTNPGELILGQYPYYVETSSSAGELRDALLAGNFTENGEPLAVTVRPAGRNEFRVRIENLRSKFADGSVTVGKERKEFSNLAPEDRVEFVCASAAPIGAKPAKVEVSVALKGEKTPRVYRFGLKAVFAAREREPADGKRKANAGFSWNDTHLSMRVPVKGRTLKLVLDPMSDGPGDDDFEYEVTADASGKCKVVRHRASSASYDSLGKEIGVIAEVEAEYAAKGNGGVFRLAFPRRAVSPFKLEAGNTMRIALDGIFEGDLVLMP